MDYLLALPGALAIGLSLGLLVGIITGLVGAGGGFLIVMGVYILARFAPEALGLSL